ncbi:putative carboxynorspermidine decarboxylase, partial [Vibrio parahaemolyticus V-223/04]|jgi:uncharacterized membrane protein (UPF0127 family)
LRTS